MLQCCPEADHSQLPGTKAGMAAWPALIGEASLHPCLDGSIPTSTAWPHEFVLITVVGWGSGGATGCCWICCTKAIALPQHSKGEMRLNVPSRCRELCKQAMPEAHPMIGHNTAVQQHDIVGGRWYVLHACLWWWSVLDMFTIPVARWSRHGARQPEGQGVAATWPTWLATTSLTQLTPLYICSSPHPSRE
ncbi:hypothetical protein HaLaN_05585 [Haematococcus lacustris]|uniref:Uncharacterized protein n=1 Tax=Haematococcus lacustris TaxID=44745 RepID=A0A699YV13_HAELA|nr:hypothetical protein HaLaN_05585 [Haematococcus lacustris]